MQAWFLEINSVHGIILVDVRVFVCLYSRTHACGDP